VLFVTEKQATSIAIGVERTSSRAGVAYAEVQRLFTGTVSPIHVVVSQALISTTESGPKPHPSSEVRQRESTDRKPSTMNEFSMVVAHEQNKGRQIRARCTANTRQEVEALM
jgi:hypothetical protein